MSLLLSQEPKDFSITNKAIALPSLHDFLYPCKGSAADLRLP